MARTIEITDGVLPTTTRNWLKKEMEQFGEVDVCHMGNRENPREEPPWVRFCEPRSAEKAMAAIMEGKVYLDGLQIKAELRSGMKRPAPPPRRRETEQQRRDLDFSSRDFYIEQGARGRDKRDRDRRRRSPSSRSRSRSRSRDRGRRRRGRS
uniref:RRM domain-containing protein n=1 Tax=Alexandrium monilatum TaxID=311494 RepID=A0A7S4V566_9DINO